MLQNNLENGNLTTDAVATATEATAAYQKTIYRKDAVWENDMVVFHTESTTKNCRVQSLMVRTSVGDIHAESKIVYNIPKFLIYSEYLSKASNWEFFTIEYDLFAESQTYLPDLRGKIGRNFMQDESSGNNYHSASNVRNFKGAHLAAGGFGRESFESLIVNNGAVSSTQTDELAVKYKFNILARPYVGGATGEEESSCPDILSVASHYGNYYYEGAINEGKHATMSDTKPNTGDRKDITSGPTEFLKNTVAISAGEKADGTGIWTSYGYGVEFFEPYHIQTVKNMYPEESYYFPLFRAYVVDLRTISSPADISGYNPGFAMGLYVGKTITLHKDNERLDYVVTEIIDNDTIKIDKDIALPIGPSNHYFWEWGTRYQILGGVRKVSEGKTVFEVQQSATCSFVAGKLAAIQDHTDANWQIVREAARMTASNSTMQVVNGKKVYTTNWDMKRGFGIIDVQKAVEYIKDNYSNNEEYLDSAVVSLPQGNPLLQYKDITPDNYITKKMLGNIFNGEKPNESLRISNENIPTVLDLEPQIIDEMNITKYSDVTKPENPLVLKLDYKKEFTLEKDSFFSCSLGLGGIGDNVIGFGFDGGGYIKNKDTGEIIEEIYAGGIDPVNKNFSRKLLKKGNYIVELRHEGGCGGPAGSSSSHAQFQLTMYFTGSFQPNVKETVVGVDGISVADKSTSKYFRLSPDQLSMKMNTDMPGVLFSGRVIDDSRGADMLRVWGAKKHPEKTVEKRGTGYYRIYHSIQHWNYSVQITPTTANRTYYISTNNNLYFEVRFYSIGATPELADSGFHFQLVGEN